MRRGWHCTQGTILFLDVSTLWLRSEGTYRQVKTAKVVTCGPLIIVMEALNFNENGKGRRIKAVHAANRLGTHLNA